ncbi:MAG: GMC family oxidoreductase [Deltaproteobacteria bacterium]|nr:GMC family oxidoreductase [Deltaproteobacteria bacterium]
MSLNSDSPAFKPELHNGSRLERDLELEADVVVVGTGAGGGMVAQILSGAGLRVVMLEEGPYRMAADFTLREGETYADMYFEGAARKTADGGVTILQGRGVGGGTTVNWTASFRTPRRTLEHWREAHGLKGLGEEDLSPWFENVERLMNIQPWALPPNSNNAALARGAQALGWHHAVMSRNVRGCASLGFCGLGCPIDAKQSTLVAAIPQALKQGAVLASRVRAERLLVSGDRVRGVLGTALDDSGSRPTGRRVVVNSRAVVAAAGGINTPALLLRSAVPDPHQLLGRRTMLHPVSASVALMPGETDSFRGVPQSVYSDEFLWPAEPGENTAPGYKLETPPVLPALVLSGMYFPRGDFRRLAGGFRSLQVMIALMRDGFHEQSPGGQVRLRDDGSPLLDYPVTPYLMEGMLRSLESMARIQFAAGAVGVIPAHMDARMGSSPEDLRRAIGNLARSTPALGVFSAHVMGGCAMGSEPRTGVVNEQGRHHQLQNLYIMDASVFPTGLGVNPQVTIFALAARNAGALARELAP